jgi:pyruvate dehydrogenase E1 component
LWAAADQRARGFLVGATSGRTTLSGEGLQHQDGSSHLMAAAIPNCRSYDPAFAHEVAVIVEDGMRAMLAEQRDVFYYLTVTNENIAHPVADAAWREGIVRGLYRIEAASSAAQVRLVGSGAMLPEALAAASLLREDFGVSADVFSATSYSELAREGAQAERSRRRVLATAGEVPEEAQPEGIFKASPTWVEQQLGTSNAPVIAASDYVRAWPELIRAQISARYVTLGTDGFGRSDTRAALRAFFEVDRFHIAFAALAALVEEGALPVATAQAAARKYNISLPDAAPWQR